MIGQGREADRVRARNRRINLLHRVVPVESLQNPLQLETVGGRQPGVVKPPFLQKQFGPPQHFAGPAQHQRGVGLRPHRLQRDDRIVHTVQLRPGQVDRHAGRRLAEFDHLRLQPLDQPWVIGEQQRRRHVELPQPHLSATRHPAGIDQPADIGRAQLPGGGRFPHPRDHNLQVVRRHLPGHELRVFAVPDRQHQCAVVGPQNGRLEFLRQGLPLPCLGGPVGLLRLGGRTPRS